MSRSIPLKKWHNKLTYTKEDALRCALLIGGIFSGRLVEYEFLRPFGIAYLSIFFNDGLDFFIIAAGVVIGMIMPVSRTGNLPYIITVLVLCIAQAVAIKTKSKFKPAYKALISALALILVKLAAQVLKELNTFFISTAMLEGIMLFALTLIYNKAYPTLKKKNRKRNISNEEIISLTIVFAACVAGSEGINISGVSINLFLSIFAVLFISYSGGAGQGAAAGVILGLTQILTKEVTLVYLALLSISGVLSGFFKELGKLCTFAGFIIGTLCIILYFDKSIATMPFYISYILAGCCFLMLPKSVKWYFPGAASSGFNEDDYIKRLKDVTSQRIQSVSASFEKLGKTLLALSENKSHSLTQKDVSRLIDEVAEKSCSHCNMSEHCWEKDFYNTYQAVFSILSSCEKKGYTTIDDIPHAFQTKCVYVSRFIDVTNRTFELYKNDLAWRNKVVESRQLVSQQLYGVAAIMDNLSEEIDLELRFKPMLEDELMDEFEKQGMGVVRVIVLENKTGKYEVNLVKRKNCQNLSGGRSKCLSALTATIERILGRKMAPMYYCDSNRGTSCQIRIREEQVYKITNGVARLTKTGMTSSGDSYSFMELRDGKCMLALSDGMGSGVEAAQESAASVELLEQFMESGFEHNLAIRMINSVLVLRAESESFSTLDMCVVDLHTGAAQFAKIGAATTFLMRGGEVCVLRSKSLPIGILANIEIETTAKTLKDGDIIIMVTDGVIDSAPSDMLQEKENWLCKILKMYNEEVKSNNPQDVAEYVLTKAKSTYDGIIKDDMTVLTARIWKR